MLSVGQEFGSGFHGFQDARFAFQAEITSDVRLSRNVANKRFGAMDVEIIDDDMPAFDMRVCLDHLANMFNIIVFGAGRSSGNPDNAPKGNIESKDEG